MAYEIVKNDDQWIVREQSQKYGKDLSERLFEFATRLIRFLRTIPKSEETRIIKYQLIKAGTSTGANYEESQGAISRNDFSNKCAIVLKEAKEANYWLRLIKSTEIDNSNELDFLIKESSELKSIFASIVKKTRPRQFK